MTQHQIEQQVHRYHINNVNYLMRDINNDIEANLRNNKKSAYVIVLVPIRHQFNLPNYFVSGINDLIGVSDFIKDNARGNYQEIWFFRKRSISNKFSGRVIFLDDSTNNQIIEIIDGDTFRNLEKSRYNIYLVGERINWGRSFKLQTNYLSDSNDVMSFDPMYLMSNAYVNLERIREDIECFSGFLGEIGLNKFSLDFILSDDILQIIDWDTENDKKIYSFLNRNETAFKQQFL